MRTKVPTRRTSGQFLIPEEKPGSGVLYVHIEPKASFTAIGFYQPDQLGLTRIREAIADRWKEFHSAIDRLAQAELVLGESEILKRVPRGFESFAEAECAKYLKYKSFVVSRRLTETDLRSPELPAKLTLFASEGLPLLKFGWKALGR